MVCALCASQAGCQGKKQTSSQNLKFTMYKVAALGFCAPYKTVTNADC